MEHSNLGFRVWLWALYLMSVNKKGSSALEMQRLIGHSRHELIWLLMHKIRFSMGHRDDNHALEGYIEMDEVFLKGTERKRTNTKASKELDKNTWYVKKSAVKRLSNNDVNYETRKLIGK